MRRRQATIKDIASYLGVSHPTVSRALNDSPKISEETKRLVRQTAKDLGYIANAPARMMRRNYNALIGLAIPDIRNDFYSAVARALAKQSREAGFQMLLVNTEDDPSVEHNQIRALTEARAAGIVITPTPKPLPATAKSLESTTTVQFVRRSSRLPGDVVCMDDVSAMREAAQHLIALGHSRIGYVGTRKDISVGQERLNGYLEAHRNANLSVDEQYISLVSPRQDQGTESVALQLSLPRPPTALIIGSSELTIGGLDAIRAAGVQVPKKLSVVGYGDPVWLRLLSPALTAVPLPVESLVEATMSLILRRIAQDTGLHERVELSIPHPGLIVRQSSSWPGSSPLESARFNHALPG